MEKIKNLGKTLSKEEQKKIRGGNETIELGPCPSDMSCANECPRQTSCKKEPHLSYCDCYSS